MRSKRSQSSLEFDGIFLYYNSENSLLSCFSFILDLENKAKDLKHKLKQQYKINEKQKKEIDQLKRTISMLDDEKKHLQNEIKLLDKDDSQSDISETVKEQHKDLIDSIHEKNKQISHLLDDIEVSNIFSHSLLNV